MPTSRDMSPREGATRAEFAERDAAIRRARAAGASIDELAAAHGIGRRQVQRIVAGARTPPAQRTRTPPAAALAVLSDWGQELEAVLRVHSAVLDELDGLARATRHDGVRLGALRARADLAVQRLALFQHAPAVRQQPDLRALLDQFLRILAQHRDEIPAAVLDDLAAIAAEHDLKEAA